MGEVNGDYKYELRRGTLGGYTLYVKDYRFDNLDPADTVRYSYMRKATAVERAVFEQQLMMNIKECIVI